MDSYRSHPSPSHQPGLHSHWAIPLSGQRSCSRSLQAGACHRLLLPALGLWGILCSNRSSGKPDCRRLLPCLCLTPNFCHIPWAQGDQLGPPRQGLPPL